MKLTRWAPGWTLRVGKHALDWHRMRVWQGFRLRRWSLAVAWWLVTWGPSQGTVSHD